MPNTLPTHIRRFVAIAALVIPATLLLSGTGPAQAVTQAEATAFFKDLDDQLLPGKGPALNALYLPGVANPTPAQLLAITAKYVEDLNAVQAASAASADLEYDRSRANVPTQKKIDDYNDALKKAKDSGALDRISTLQFNILKKHFPDAGNTGVDFAKAQDVITMFANGKLRTGGPGSREMNGLGDWYNWKGVARAAIEAGVQKAAWEKLLPRIETGLEIYRQVYPPVPAAIGVGAPVQTSVASRFDATKQLSDADIAALANTINGLTTAQIFDREGTKLKVDTTAALMGLPSNGAVALASATATPVQGGLQIQLMVDVTDPTGLFIDGDSIEFLFAESALVLPPGTFQTQGFLTGIGNGRYETSFLAPFEPRGFWFWVMDDNAQSSVMGVIRVIPEPATWALLACGIVVLSLARRHHREG